MKIFLYSLLLWSSYSFGNCRVKNHYKLISLSGPVTSYVFELGLLKDLKGISFFNSIPMKGYDGLIFPGGIHLSKKSIQQMHGHVVFFDEAQSLKKIFQDESLLNPVMITTRSLGPLDTMTKISQLLNPYLEGCQSRHQEIMQRAQQGLDFIRTRINKNKTYLFYLGEITSKNRPQLLIIHDSIIGHLIQKFAMKTYPSPLSYVSWSAKLIREIPGEILHVGLKDSQSSGNQEVKRQGGDFNLIYPGVLVPGLSQIRAFEFFFRELP